MIDDRVIKIIAHAVDEGMYVNISRSQCLDKYEVEIGFVEESTPVSFAYNSCLESAMFQIEDDLNDFGIIYKDKEV